MKIIFVVLAVVILIGLNFAFQNAQAQREQIQTQVLLGNVRLIANGPLPRPSPSSTPCNIHVTTKMADNPLIVLRVLELLNPQ